MDQVKSMQVENIKRTTNNIAFCQNLCIIWTQLVSLCIATSNTRWLEKKHSNKIDPYHDIAHT